MPHFLKLTGDSMYRISTGQDRPNDTAAKIACLGPAVVGALMLGPVGFLAGLTLSILQMVSDDNSPPSDGAQPELAIS
jgi:hypothetical protein